MSNPYMNDDAVAACIDLVGRCCASKLEIGYLHDDVPPELAGWYAQVMYQGTRIIVDDQPSPAAACEILAASLLHGAMCRCGQLVAVSDTVAGCRWQLVGRRWEPGCDAEPMTIPAGERGRYQALARAAAEQAGHRTGAPVNRDRRVIREQGQEGPHNLN